MYWCWLKFIYYSWRIIALNFDDEKVLTIGKVAINFIVEDIKQDHFEERLP